MCFVCILSRGNEKAAENLQLPKVLPGQCLTEVCRFASSTSSCPSRVSSSARSQHPTRVRQESMCLFSLSLSKYCFFDRITECRVLLIYSDVELQFSSMPSCVAWQKMFISGCQHQEGHWLLICICTQEELRILIDSPKAVHWVWAHSKWNQPDQFRYREVNLQMDSVMEDKLNGMGIRITSALPISFWFLFKHTF